LAPLRDCVACVAGQVWDPQGKSADRTALDQLQLAVQEAASNIIRHAYASEPGRPIEVVIEADRGRICVSLHHWGADFDWSSVEPPAFDGSRTGGFGVYLIEQSVDEVTYFCDDAHKNTIRLVKYRASETLHE
jgi:serine/threonine-protein kinase RsbW